MPEPSSHAQNASADAPKVLTRLTADNAATTTGTTFSRVRLI